MAHRTTLLQDRSDARGTSANVGWETRGKLMSKSGICDTKPAISLKRSSLEPKLLQSIYRNTYVYGISIGDKFWQWRIQRFSLEWATWRAREHQPITRVWGWSRQWGPKTELLVRERSPLKLKNFFTWTYRGANLSLSRRLSGGGGIAPFAPMDPPLKSGVVVII